MLFVEVEKLIPVLESDSSLLIKSDVASPERIIAVPAVTT
jgi:hypothetical protein